MRAALLRPGRFDRRVTVGPPDVRGRLGILKVHTRKTPLDSGVDLEVIAKAGEPDDMLNWIQHLPL